MSLAFTDSGMVTRGMGKDNRLATRGMGGDRFDWGGIRRRRRTKDYVFDMFIPISKTGRQQTNIYSPLEIGRSMEVSMMVRISKELEGEMDIITKTDHSRLSRILDAI